MNYIDITTPSVQGLNININLDDVAATDNITWSVYADGNDTAIVAFDNELGNAQVTLHKYYHRLGVNTAALTGVEDETQYNLVGVFNNKVVYRGKFQTTSKDILDYSINENKYTQKTNATNYTILD